MEIRFHKPFPSKNAMLIDWLATGIRKNRMNEPQADLPQLLDVAEVAKKLKTSERTVFSLYRSGELAHVKFGRLVRFRPIDIANFISMKLR